MNAVSRTMVVEQGQDVELTWLFETDKNVVFNGVVWMIYDHLYKKNTKLIWLNSRETVVRHLHTQHRPEFNATLGTRKVNDTVVRVIVVVSNVQQVHSNTYVCHVITASVPRSQITLKVVGKHNETLSVIVFRFGRKCNCAKQVFKLEISVCTTYNFSEKILCMSLATILQ